MILGAHVSISGGIENSIKNARDMGCETFQIFTKNQSQWKEKTYSSDQAEMFKKNLKDSRFAPDHLISHISYLINLCAANEQLLLRSRHAFVLEIKRCDSLNIRNLVFHPGAHTGQGEDRGLEQIAASMIWILQQTPDSQVRLLLETTAGQGTTLGYCFEQLAALLEAVGYAERTGVCVDTCHIFAAGYDLRSKAGYCNTMNKLDDIIGLDRVFAFHLNDSKREAGSRIDRHEVIGKGQIGDGAFCWLMNEPGIRKIPGILEIPGGMTAFIESIEKLKGFRERVA